jgi:sulfatase maturation enzyme AslB (radical SAM superfamily)
MVNGRGFKTHEDLHNSEWLLKIRNKMKDNHWPDECVRCEQSEKVKGQSIRTNSIDRHNLLSPIRKDYLVVGGVLDNICNSACQTCNSGLSTKIGSLESRNYPRVNNLEVFKKLPMERIIELDVNGGEPTASSNYKKLLTELPENVKIVRMNTNGSRMIDEIENLLKRNIKVIVTLSFDGIGDTHDYIRWPIQWKNYKTTVESYLNLRKTYKHLSLDMWTTVSCLNIATLQDIIGFAKEKSISHDWAFLDRPKELNVRYKNKFTESEKHMFPDQIAVDRDNTAELEAFIEKQDKLRNIDIKDYFNLGPNFSKKTSANLL